LPTGQEEHEFSVRLENEPAAQATQSVPSAEVIEPESELNAQEEDPAIGLYSPPAQVEQEDAPELETVPAGQIRHDTSAPVENLPEEQAKHVDAPGAAKVPGAQYEQAVIPCFVVTKGAAQTKHEVKTCPFSFM